jgi:hypothetical protein
LNKAKRTAQVKYPILSGQGADCAIDGWAPRRIERSIRLDARKPTPPSSSNGRDIATDDPSASMIGITHGS